MQAVAQRKDTYLADVEEFRRTLPEPQPASLTRLRRAAAARFTELGFPTTRQEAWRSTNVAAIAEGEFRRAAVAGAVSREAAAPWMFEGAFRLTFVDGHFAPRLSDLDGLPEGVRLGRLGEAMEGSRNGVLTHLGRYASFDSHPFVALNTAFLADGAYLQVPRGVVVERPIHLLFLASGEGAERAAYPRNLLVMEENSQATVVETYAGPEGARYFTCPVTEIVAGPNAVLDHYKVQRESTAAFHVATQQIYQGRSSNLSSHSISIGGALTRNDINAVLDDEGIESTLNGLYLADGDQHVDHHMRVDHAKPHCNSHELYKGILDGHARSVFNGLIHVHPDAQKTDAKQSNRNLLLSKEALAHSNPQLEIFADDVRCTHGSTVGQLDDLAIFYLRSRGIGLDAARSILTYAFASDIVERIRVEAVRSDLEELLFRRLPRGEVVRQAV